MPRSGSLGAVCRGRLLTLAALDSSHPFGHHPPSIICPTALLHVLAPHPLGGTRDDRGYGHAQPFHAPDQVAPQPLRDLSRSVEMMISSELPSRTAAWTDSNGSWPPTSPSTVPRVAGRRSRCAVSIVQSASLRLVTSGMSRANSQGPRIGTPCRGIETQTPELDFAPVSARGSTGRLPASREVLSCSPCVPVRQATGCLGPSPR
jgi:hypothetical protein